MNLVLTDIDECTIGSHNCHSNARCDNNIGGFLCTCNDGYSGSGTTCTGKNTKLLLITNDLDVHIFIAIDCRYTLAMPAGNMTKY